MKKKKIKKIAKLIFTEVNSLQKMDAPIRERVDYVPYDSEVSEKTKNLILKLIDYNENVNINFSSESFSISTPDITSIKKRASKNTLYNDDNYLDIHVIKDEGFSINLAYQKRTNYEDKDIFIELIDMVTKRVMETNRENFTAIWDKVMKDSGIIRDNNLEQLFDE
jgi:hypothetical protein